MSETLFLRVTSEWKKRLEDQAKISGRTMTEIITGAVDSSIGAITGASEQDALAREAEQLSARLMEMEKNQGAELDKSATLAHFYGVFESREPLKCLDQALKDFDHYDGVWRVEDRDAAEFSGTAEVIRALAMAENYIALKKRLDGITAKLRTPLEGWEEKQRELEEIRKKKEEEERSAEEQRKKLVEEKAEEMRKKKRGRKPSGDGVLKKTVEESEEDWWKESDRILGYRHEEKS